MARDLRNFKLEIWVTAEVARAVQDIARAQESTESAVGRMALRHFLQSIGAMPQPNGRTGAMTEETAHG